MTNVLTKLADHLRPVFLAVRSIATQGALVFDSRVQARALCAELRVPQPGLLAPASRPRGLHLDAKFGGRRASVDLALAPEQPQVRRMQMQMNMCEGVKM